MHTDWELSRHLLCSTGWGVLGSSVAGGSDAASLSDLYSVFVFLGF